MAMSRQKKLDKMDIIELAKEKPKPEFVFQEARTAGKIIFETKDLVIGYDEALSRPLNLTMERGEKVVLKLSLIHISLPSLTIPAICHRNLQMKQQEHWLPTES